MQFEAKPLDPRSLKIHERALACARRYLTAEVALLEALMDADRHRIHEQFVLPALTPYCVKMLGLSEDVAACFVRVARKCAQVPELLEAMRAGKVTLFKARTISAVLTKENHGRWIQRASELSKEKLEQEVREAAGRALFTLKLSFTKEQWQLVKRAQEVVSQILGRPASIEETLEIAIDFYLEAHDPVRRADRIQTKSHNDRSRDQSPTSSLRIPSRIRHAVHRRDRGRCQARLPDGTTCGDSRWVHLHHVVPRSEGGEDSTENLVTLCSAHHRQWHQAH